MSESESSLPQPEGEGFRHGVERGLTQPAGGGATILLVEDEETVRRVTTRLLQRLGYAVIPARDAQEAMAIIAAGEQRLDLVFTDVVMPGLTGIQMAELIRETRPDLKILFSSGYTSRELGRAPGAPPEPFLPKPFSLEELSGKVKEVLEDS